MLRLAAVLLVLGFILGGSGNSLQAEPKRDANKFRERIETLTMWKMMEALDLDKETSEKILSLRRKFETKRNELEASINGDLQKLRDLVKNAQESSDRDLAELINTIRAKRRQLDDLRDAHFTDMSKVLSVKQQAKLILFLKDFRREIRDMIRSSMRHRPPGGEFKGPGEGFGGPGGDRLRHPPEGRLGPPPGAGPPGPLPAPRGQWGPGAAPDDVLESR